MIYQLLILLNYFGWEKGPEISGYTLHSLHSYKLLQAKVHHIGDTAVR